MIFRVVISERDVVPSCAGQVCGVWASIVVVWYTTARVLFNTKVEQEEAMPGMPGCVSAHESVVAEG